MQNLLPKAASFALGLSGFATGLLSQTPQPSGQSTNPVLVQAVVVSASAGTAEIISTQKIVHVYWGQQNLLGRTFTASSSANGDTKGQRLYPPLTVGEVGIWCLVDLQSNLVLAGSSFPGMTWPARQSHNSRYSEMKSLAEEIEAFDRNNKEDRIAFLQRAALSSVPEVAEWAVRSAGALKLKERDGLYATWKSMSNLPIAAQIALDAELSQSNPDTWQRSPERLAILKTWVITTMSDFEAYHVVERLGLVAQNSELDPKTVFLLLQQAVENPSWSIPTRGRALYYLGLCAQRGNDAGLTFDFMVRLIRENQSKELQRLAAQTIKNCIALTNDRASTVQLLKERLTDRNLSGILDEALKRSGSFPNKP
jgi:hypothetical protein